MHSGNDNPCKPLSETLSAVTVTPYVATTGVLHGIKQAGSASSEATKAFRDKAFEMDSFLAALEALLKEQDDLDINDVCGVFPELKDSFAASANFIASVAFNASTAPTAALTNVSQLGLDLSVSIHGLLNSIQDANKFTRLDASTVDFEKERHDHTSGFSAHCQALRKELGGICKEVAKVIDKDFGDKVGCGFAPSHASLAKMTALVPGAITLGSAALLSLGIDSIGSMFRESSIECHAMNKESASEGEKNIYNAFSNCCKFFSSENHNSKESLEALKKLETAISNFDLAIDMFDNHSGTSSAISVLVRGLTSEPFVGALRLINSSAIALSIASDAMSKENAALSQISRFSVSKASSTKEVCEGGENHSMNVTQLCQHFDKVIKHIDDDLKNLAGAADHDKSAINVSAQGSVRVSSGLSMIPSLITGFAGCISREFISGTIDFTNNDKGTRQEFTQVYQSRRAQTGKDLDALMARVSQLQERVQRCDELKISMPVVLGVSHVVTCGALIATLNGIAGICFALSEINSLSESPNAATELDQEEKIKAAEYKQSAIDSNKKTANTMGTGSISDNLQLHQCLESIMNKVVLTHRSQLNFLQPGDDRENINKSGKTLIASSQGNCTGFLSGALGVLALVSLQSGISVETFFRALSAGCIQSNRLNDGVDQIKIGENFKSNLSIVSNATRLSAEKAEKASVTQTASRTSYHVAEALSSRSLTVALCNSGILSKALRDLSKAEEEKLERPAHFLESTLISAAVMDKLGEHILLALNNAEDQNHRMPELNRDMASQLHSASYSSIVSSLSAHSVFISPFLQTSAAIKAANHTEANEKNEAVSEASIISKTVSMGMNSIQAFTKHSIKALQDQADSLPKDQRQRYNSIMQTHFSANTASASAMVATCCLSLLVDELIETMVSRSLTLLDREKVAKTFNQSSQESQAHSHVSGKAISADSELGEVQSATRIISALRLTLSHFGQSLVAYGNALQDKSSNDHHDLLQQPLELHSAQESMLKCLSACMSGSGLGMLQVSGILSMLPLSSGGTLEDIRHFIHTSDHELGFKQIQSSANCTRDDSSESSLTAGMSTDSTVNIVVSLIKALLRSALFGIDTTLSVAKIFEIFSLHDRPEQALSLETQAVSEPNGVSRNMNSQRQRLSIAASAATASLLADTKCDEDCSDTNQLIRSLQHAVDVRIDECGMLADEEENNLLGLKQFFEVLIRVLAAHENFNANASEANIKDLVERFNKGGISLSQYHTTNGGIKSYLARRDRLMGNNNNALIYDGQFLECDNAASLLNAFIFKATKDEVDRLKNAEGKITLLSKLKTELGAYNKTLSNKADGRYQYILKRVSDQLSLVVNRSSVITPRHSLKTLFNKRDFHEHMKDYKKQVQNPEGGRGPGL